MSKPKKFDESAEIALAVFAPITLGLLATVVWLWFQQGMAVLIAATFLIPALLLLVINLLVVSGLAKHKRKAAAWAIVLVPLAWLPAGLFILQFPFLTGPLAYPAALAFIAITGYLVVYYVRLFRRLPK